MHVYLKHNSLFEMKIRLDAIVLLWTESCHLKIHVAALTSNITAFGFRAFMEIIKVKRDHKSRLLSVRAGVSISRGRDTKDLSLYLS